MKNSSRIVPVEKLGNTLYFDSEINRYSFTFDNRAFSSNPEARAICTRFYSYKK